MYAFTFRQLEVFLEICHDGNFSGAAGRLDVSQPAISNVIRTLESQLGVELFERRRGSSCVLTRDGKALRDCTQQFVAQCDNISRGVRSRFRPLQVFVGEHLLDDYLRPLLPEFYETNPQLQMNFLPENTRDQIRQYISADKVDVAVVTTPPDERLENTVLVGTVAAGVYGASEFHGHCSAKDLSSCPFILPTADGQLGNSMLHQLELHGVRPTRIAGYFPYHELRVQLACRGKGVLFAVQSVIDKHDPQGLLHVLFPTAPWERRLYISPRLDRSTASAVTNFVSESLRQPTAAQH